MDAYLNIKNSLIMLAVGALLFIIGAIVCHNDMLMAVLMIAGIACMGFGGACFIRTTSMKDGKPNNRDQWLEFDFGHICQ